MLFFIPKPNIMNIRLFTDLVDDMESQHGIYMETGMTEFHATKKITRYKIITDASLVILLADIVSAASTVAANIIMRFTPDKRDGRVDSAIMELPFLQALKDLLPDYDVEIPCARAKYDIKIEGIWFNLKLPTYAQGSADNVMNKEAVFYSLTGEETCPLGNWAKFHGHLQNSFDRGRKKLIRDKTTEYYFLVVFKDTGNVMLKSIFDIECYYSNPSNVLQINWKKEYDAGYVCPYDGYIEKAKELLGKITKSLQQDIEAKLSMATIPIEW